MKTVNIKDVIDTIYYDIKTYAKGTKLSKTSILKILQVINSLNFEEFINKDILNKVTYNVATIWHVSTRLQKYQWLIITANSNPKRYKQNVIFKDISKTIEEIYGLTVDDNLDCIDINTAITTIHDTLKNKKASKYSRTSIYTILRLMMSFNFKPFTSRSLYIENEKKYSSRIINILQSLNYIKTLRGMSNMTVHLVQNIKFIGEFDDFGIEYDSLQTIDCKEFIENIGKMKKMFSKKVVKNGSIHTYIKILLWIHSLNYKEFDAHMLISDLNLSESLTRLCLTTLTHLKVLKRKPNPDNALVFVYKLNSKLVNLEYLTDLETLTSDITITTSIKAEEILKLAENKGFSKDILLKVLIAIDKINYKSFTIQDLCTFINSTYKRSIVRAVTFLLKCNILIKCKIPSLNNGCLYIQNVFLENLYKLQDISKTLPEIKDLSIINVKDIDITKHYAKQYKHKIHFVLKAIEELDFKLFAKSELLPISSNLSRNVIDLLFIFLKQQNIIINTKFKATNGEFLYRQNVIFEGL